MKLKPCAVIAQMFKAAMIGGCRRKKRSTVAVAGHEVVVGCRRWKETMVDVGCRRWLMSTEDEGERRAKGHQAADSESGSAVQEVFFGCRR